MSDQSAEGRLRRLAAIDAWGRSTRSGSSGFRKFSNLVHFLDFSDFSHFLHLLQFFAGWDFTRLNKSLNQVHKKQLCSVITKFSTYANSMFSRGGSLADREESVAFHRCHTFENFRSRYLHTVYVACMCRRLNGRYQSCQLSSLTLSLMILKIAILKIYSIYKK
jgi:hypothetical protein